MLLYSLKKERKFLKVFYFWWFLDQNGALKLCGRFCGRHNFDFGVFLISKNDSKISQNEKLKKIPERQCHSDPKTVCETKFVYFYTFSCFFWIFFKKKIRFDHDYKVIFLKNLKRKFPKFWVIFGVFWPFSENGQNSRSGVNGEIFGKSRISKIKSNLSKRHMSKKREGIILNFLRRLFTLWKFIAKILKKISIFFKNMKKGVKNDPQRGHFWEETFWRHKYWRFEKSSKKVSEFFKKKLGFFKSVKKVTFFWTKNWHFVKNWNLGSSKCLFFPKTRARKKHTPNYPFLRKSQKT